MPRRKIKSAVVLSLVGAMILGLFGCSAAPAVKDNTDPAVQTIAAEEISPLTAAYAEGKATYETIEKAAASGQTAVLTQEAGRMAENIRQIRTQSETAFAQTRAVLDTLQDSKLLSRQKAYETYVYSSLAQAEQAAAGLTDKQQAEQNVQTIAALFEETKEPEVVTYGTAYNNVKISPKTTATSAPADYTAPTEADLALTGEVAINETIQKLCDELGTAKRVYEFVHNGFGYEPYYHSKKGAVATFDQLGGNDADLASLLIGMLRYLKIPARYVQGRVLITGEQAIALTGADTIENAGAILAAQYKPVMMYTENGKLTGFIMEQIWVQAYVPYTDYRGAGHQSGDHVWVSMDPSFKSLKVEDMVLDNDLDAEEVKANTAAMQKINPDYEAPAQITLKNRYIDQTTDKYLPVSLPYAVQSVTRTFSAMPAELRDSISVSVGWSTLMSAPVSELYGKSVIVSFEPETESDQRIIDSYGGLDKVPAYLVSVVPTVSVDGVQYRGDYAVTLGSSQKMNITVNNAGGSTNIPDTVYAGSVYAVSFDMQQISQQELSNSQARVNAVKNIVTDSNIYSAAAIGPILDFAGKWYFKGCDAYATRMALTLDIKRTRQLAVAVTGYRMTPVTMFGRVTSLDYGDFLIDVDYNLSSNISYTGSDEQERTFLMATGFKESAYEGELWQEILADDAPFGISTVSIFAAGLAYGLKPVVLTQANLAQDIEKCHIPDMTKNSIISYVNAGRVVVVMPETFKVGDWTGTAYMATDMADGSTAYMISGGFAGGSNYREYSLRFSDHQPKLSDYVDTEQMMILCYRINILISAVEQEMALISLVGDVMALETASLNVAGAMAAVKTFNDAKSFADAVQMYYDNLDKLIDFYLSDDPDKAAADMMMFTLSNMLGFIAGQAWDAVLGSIPGIEIGGGVIEVSDIMSLLGVGDYMTSIVMDVSRALGLFNENTEDWYEEIVSALMP